MKLTVLIVVGVLVCSCSKKGTDNGDDDDPYCDWETTVEYATDAAWSPDGTLIAFKGWDPDIDPSMWGVYFYNLNDSSVTPFIVGAPLTGMNFSPDGKWLAFSDGANIYRAAVHTDSIEQLTFSEHNFFPDWSPDGTRIAYDISLGEDGGIHVLDISTLEDHQVYAYSRRPAWFPDGQYLAVVSYNFGSDGQLAIIDTAGNLVRQLTNNDSFKRGLDVSPDGSQICFIQDFKCQLPHVWIINSDGTGLKKLTTRGGADPAFSPDGQWIVFTYLADDNGHLWIMRTDGSEKRQITFGRDTLGT